MFVQVAHIVPEVEDDDVVEVVDISSDDDEEGAEVVKGPRQSAEDERKKELLELDLAILEKRRALLLLTPVLPLTLPSAKKRKTNVRIKPDPDQSFYLAASPHVVVKKEKAMVLSSPSPASSSSSPASLSLPPVPTSPLPPVASPSLPLPTVATDKTSAMQQAIQERSFKAQVQINLEKSKKFKVREGENLNPSGQAGFMTDESESEEEEKLNKGSKRKLKKVNSFANTKSEEKEKNDKTESLKGDDVVTQTSSSEIKEDVEVTIQPPKEDRIQSNSTQPSNKVVAPKERKEAGEANSKMKNVDKLKEGENGVFYKLKEPLSWICKSEKLTHFEVMRKTWAYIRGGNLQDSKDRRRIICDHNFQRMTKRKEIDLKAVAGFLKPFMKRITRRPASCPDCSKRFYTTFNMRRHSASSHGRSTGYFDQWDKRGPALPVSQCKINEQRVGKYAWLSNTAVLVAPENVRPGEKAKRRMKMPWYSHPDLPDGWLLRIVRCYFYLKLVFNIECVQERRKWQLVFFSTCPH